MANFADELRQTSNNAPKLSNEEKEYIKQRDAIRPFKEYILSRIEPECRQQAAEGKRNAFIQIGGYDSAIADFYFWNPRKSWFRNKIPSKQQILYDEIGRFVEGKCAQLGLKYNGILVSSDGDPYRASYYIYVKVSW